MRIMTILILVASLFFVSGCASDRVEDTDGSVILSVTNFDSLPVSVSVTNNEGGVPIPSITISNFPKKPGAVTSNLMNVEIQTYQVVYTRLGTGTRTPPTLVRDIFGLAPANGTETYSGLPILGIEQMNSPPLSDLNIDNGGFDSETSSQLITLNLTLTFFGRTIAGDAVSTAPVSFTVEFVP